MHDDACVRDEHCGTSLFSRSYRKLEHGGPTGFDWQQGQLRSRDQCGQICSHTIPQLRLHRARSLEPDRQGVLDGGVHGEEGVGYDFESGQSLGLHFSGAEAGNPADLHLGKRRYFAEAADNKSKARVGANCEAFDRAAESVVEEDLVDDEGEVVLGAEGLEAVTLGAGRSVAGWVVGVDQDDGSGSRGDAAFQFCKVDPPAEVGKERVGGEKNVIEVREEVEERIAGLGGEDGVAGVAEQAEEEAVGLAGAGGEHDVCGVDLRAVAQGITRDGCAGAQDAARVRVVPESGRLGEWGEQVGGIVEAADGWVGNCQVPHRKAAGATVADGTREVAFTRIPGGTGGKVVRHSSSVRSLYNRTVPDQPSSAPVAAVLFDYGVVLSGPPDPAAWARMQQITELSEGPFSAAYWAPRHDYDRGFLTGREFWRASARHAGIALTDVQLSELLDADNELWTQRNEPMIAWAARLQAAHTPTGILSNLGDAMTEGVLERQPWLAEFDVLVWSHVLKTAKPDPAIYRHAAEKLMLSPDRILFIDDRRDNYVAALDAGMQAVFYTTQPAFEVEMSERGWQALWSSGRLAK